MATYYYAYINAENIVEQIIDLPAPISVPSYISIKSHDVSLIGKRYNAKTGQFEVVTWYCYAMLNEKDIVTEVVRLETPMPQVPNNMVVIQTYDETLVGKWYNRTSGTFSVPPIHVLAEHSTDAINVGAQDLWLTDKLGAMDEKLLATDGKVGTIDGKLAATDSKVGVIDGKLATTDGKVTATDVKVGVIDAKLAATDGKLGVIDGRLGLIDGLLNRSLKGKISEKRENKIFETSKMTKHYAYPFENAVPGYLPKYVHVQVTWGGAPFRDDDVVNMWLIRNGANTDMYASYRDGKVVYTGNSPAFIGVNKFDFFENANITEGCFSTYMYGDTITTRGGESFISAVQGYSTNQTGKVGNFKYNETGIEFDIRAYFIDPMCLTTRFAIRAFAY